MIGYSWAWGEEAAHRGRFALPWVRGMLEAREPWKKRREQVCFRYFGDVLCACNKLGLRFVVLGIHSGL